MGEGMSGPAKGRPAVRSTSSSAARRTWNGRPKASPQQVRPASSPCVAHPLAAARRRPACSRAPCTRHRADSSSHPSCLRRTLSGEVLGSNHPSYCPLPVPAALKPAAAAGQECWQEEAAAGSCRAPVRVGSQGRASLAPSAPLGRGAVLRRRSERLCVS